MVNPKSELYEKHPDWAIELPNRDTYYYRHQLVLDLSNPKVQDYVFGVVDRIMTENPEVAYFKWDCNSPITNIFSPYSKRSSGPALHRPCEGSVQHTPPCERKIPRPADDAMRRRWRTL